LKHEDTFRLAASAGELMGEPLVLPLVYQAETIGQLRLAPRTPGEPFTPADRRLLDELARQAGLSAHAVQLSADLRRSYEQLEQRVQERTRELSSLLEISHTMASTLQLKPLLGLILDQLKLVIDYTSSSILTVEGEDLVFLDNRNPVPQEHLMQLRFPLKNLGLIWETLRSRESIIVPDLREETPLAQAVRVVMGELRETTLQDVQAWMAVPLILRDQVSGMLMLTSSQEQAFTERHATLALAIANQAAIAIENARLYAQAQELAALEERQKLARELHDSVSQALYGIALGAHTARTLLERDPGLVAEPLEYILSLAKAGLAEMRALIFELRPESLETEGLVSAIIKQAAALQARHDVPVETDMCDEPSLSLTVKQELFRVAQEALHNTIKHARASQVNVRLLRTAEAIILEIRDNGRGFDSLGSFPGHLGLLSMQERVKNLAGVLSIESTPGQGTTIRARVPAREVIQT
jgi:signal transduction histidine kinase